MLQKYLRHVLLAASLATGSYAFAAAPANDNIAQAQVLTTDTAVDGTLEEATREPGDPEGGGYNYATVWYQWTAPRSGVAHLSVVSHMSYNHTHVLLGGSQLSGTFVTDDSTDSTFYAVAGTHYFICFDAYRNLVNPNTFTISISVDSSLPANTQLVTPLSNDNFSQATPIAASAANLVIHTLNAGFEPFETAMLDTVGVRGYGTNLDGGVWLAWTPQTTGKALVTAATTIKKNVVLVVGTGPANSISELNLLGWATNGGTFDCAAGRTYYLYFLDQKADGIFVQLSVGTSTGGGTISLFTAQAGVFAGLVGNSGSITLSLAAKGAFTGTLNLAGVSYPLRGALDGAGKFTGTASPAVTLALDVNASTAVLGDIAIAGTAGGQSFTAHHAAYGLKASAPELGKYTALLKPASSSAGVPQGIGFASINVSKAGAATLAGGKLADGSVLIGGGVLVGDGAGGKQLILYNKALYGGKGRVAGAIAFASATKSDCAGTLRWFKPNFNTGAYYPQGFDTGLTLTGARYAVLKNAAAVPFAGGNAHASLKDSGLNAAIVKPITLAVTNGITVNGANGEALILKLAPSTGTFSGSFHHPANPKVLTKISGVLFQNANAPEAAGFYLSPVVAGSGVSGSADLAP